MLFDMSVADQTSSQSRPRVLVVGALQLWEGHSNVEHKIKLLAEATELESTIKIREIRFKINYKSTLTRCISTMSTCLKLLLGSVGCVVTIVRYRSHDSLYLPYPGHIILFVLSFLPKSMAPKNIVLDLFISIYDTVVNDRGLIKEGGSLARVLYWFESSAFRRAQVCLVDTSDNAEYYAELFRLPNELFKVIPLSIDNHHFEPVKDHCRFSKENRSLKVLFVGTMVPLQGVSYICNSIWRLKEFSEFEIVIVGDGQDSPYVEKLERDLSESNAALRFVWKREWMDSKRIASEIRDADICLGIFGDSEKAKRVWPFKNYLYMACGKMLITSNTSTAVKLGQKQHLPAFKVIDCSDGDALANCLENVLVNRNEFREIGNSARQFYLDNLSAKVITDRMNRIFSRN